MNYVMSQNCPDPELPFYCPGISNRDCQPAQPPNSTCCRGDPLLTRICKPTETCVVSSVDGVPWPSCTKCPGEWQREDPNTGNCVDLKSAENCGQIGNACSEHQFCSGFCAGMKARCIRFCQQKNPCLYNGTIDPCSTNSNASCTPRNSPTDLESGLFECSSFPEPAPPIVTCPSGPPYYNYTPPIYKYYEKCDVIGRWYEPPNKPIRTMWRVMPVNASSTDDLHLMVALDLNGNAACISTNKWDCMYVGKKCAHDTLEDHRWPNI
jgi:hypothetical protein